MILMKEMAKVGYAINGRGKHTLGCKDPLLNPLQSPCTRNSARKILILKAKVAELADAPDLGSGAQKAWGFKSPLSHQ
jgi:hypothetical protein